MTYAIDDMWKLFQRHVSDPDVRLAFAKDLIVESEYENLAGNPYCRSLMEFLSDHDDDYFLELHYICDDTVKEVIENLDFHIDHNNLSQERRDRLFELWLKRTGNFANREKRNVALLKEKRILEERIQSIDDDIEDGGDFAS